MTIYKENTESLKELLEPYSSVFVVYDKAVADLVRDLPYPKFELLATEATKNMDTVLDIENWLLEAKAGRDAFLLALGGGITTDLSGFAACLYKRGIHFGFVPTTLLAQVDAAIGGKNGVNFRSFKNMLGVIREPDFTYVCPSVLETLPDREFREGVSELIKTAIICEDWECYDSAVELFSSHEPKAILSDPALSATFSSLVRQAGGVKEAIVGRDLYEGGERRKLNLGHTFAHAIESLALLDGMDIAHGEAVSMGMVLAAKLSAKLGLCEEDFPQMIEMDLADCGLPVDCPFPLERMLPAMSVDKKAEGGVVHFALPVDIGQVDIVDLPIEKLSELLLS